MDSRTSTLSVGDLLLLIEITARAAQRAMARHDGKPNAAACIVELRNYAEDLTNRPDCPKL